MSALSSSVTILADSDMIIIISDSVSSIPPSPHGHSRTSGYDCRRRPEGAHMDTIVTLKITLLRAKPPIWRRLEVPASYHLGELHGTLNAAMGWLDSHLHMFDVDGREYSISDDDIWIDADPPLPEESVTLADLVRDGVKRFGYWYDFGDSWHHDVVIEKTGPAENGVFYPRCVAGPVFS